MAQTLKFSIKGLHTYSSDIAGVPEGSLSVAKNVNLSRINLAECRRGFDLLAYNLPNNSDRATKIFDYDGSIFATYNNTLGIYSSGWTSKGSLTKPTNALVSRPTYIQQNLYMPSSSGLKKLDDTASSLYSAGIPKGLMIELTQSGSTGTAVPTAKSVAYRYIICRRDANNNLIRGGVSGREIYSNTSGATKDVTVKCYLPSGLDNTYFAEIYRSADASADPNDELQKCYEHPITSTDVSNGYISFSDIIPEELLGDTIYTASSQQGIANDNTEPPLASDIAVYKNYMFFADVISKNRFTFTVIACGGSSGIAVNDTITISDGTTTEVFTAKASATPASKEFAVDTASSSLAVRIDTTARSLVNVINQSSALVYAYLMSTGGSDLPGKILLESKSLGSDEFTVISNRQTAYSPQLKSTADSSQTSKNDEYRNGLMFSKYQIAEAVPLKNIFFVGSSDDPIVRILPLRDGLFIFKRKDGVYVLRGESESSFSVSQFDSTAKIVAGESLVTLNSQIYGLFEAGICAVSDNSVEVISQPIRDKIQTLYGQCLQQVKDYSFGVPYETDGKYILSLPQTSSDTSATYQLIYDVFNNTFCEWDLNIGSGFVSSSDNKLYLASGNSNKIRQEKKSYSYTDFADYEQSCTLSSASTTTLTISGTDYMAVGDLLIQADLSPAYIQSVDVTSGTVVVDIDQTWDTGQPVEHQKAIDCVIQWNPEFAGNPAGFKHFSECNILFNQGIIQSAAVGFASDLSAGEIEVEIDGSSSNGAWGDFDWNDVPWGGEVYPEPVRIGVPRISARCNNLTVKFSHKIAYSDWQLSGLALSFNPISTRTAR